MKYLKEIKAVEKSIEHWNRDILDQYNNGDSTRQLHALIWASDLENVKFGAKDCQLCEDFYAFSSEPCDKCPYNQVWKYPCTHEGMHWNRFALNPCIGTAQDMVKALKVVKDYFYCNGDKMDFLTNSFPVAQAVHELRQQALSGRNAVEAMEKIIIAYRNDDDWELFTSHLEIAIKEYQEAVCPPKP